MIYHVEGKYLKNCGYNYYKLWSIHFVHFIDVTPKVIFFKWAMYQFWERVDSIFDLYKNVYIHKARNVSKKIRGIWRIVMKKYRKGLEAIIINLSICCFLDQIMLYFLISEKIFCSSLTIEQIDGICGKSILNHVSLIWTNMPRLHTSCNFLFLIHFNNKMWVWNDHIHFIHITNMGPG